MISKITPENLADLYKLARDIDALIDQIDPDFEPELTERIYSQIRGIAIDLGIHREFLKNYARIQQKIAA